MRLTLSRCFQRVSDRTRTSPQARPAVVQDARRRHSLKVCGVLGIAPGSGPDVAARCTLKTGCVGRETPCPRMHRGCKGTALEMRTANSDANGLTHMSERSKISTEWTWGDARTCTLATCSHKKASTLSTNSLGRSAKQLCCGCRWATRAAVRVHRRAVLQAAQPPDHGVAIAGRR